MSKVIPITNKQQIAEQAGLWLARIERGLSGEERKLIESWLAENGAHADALTELASIWDDMAVLEELSDLFPLPEESPANSAAEQKGFRRWPIYTVATMLAVFALFITLTTVTDIGIPEIHKIAKLPALELKEYHSPADATLQLPGEQYETAIGEQSKVNLPDGSVITLNTATRVLVNYDENSREIILEHGEGYFEVAKDHQRPFRVIANNNLVQAVGTAFNVDYSNTRQLEVTVTEGQVKLVSPKKVKQILLTGSLPKESLVSSGQSATIASSDQHTLKNVSKEEIDKQLAWQQGMIVFEREPLNKALSELSRYTLVEFVLTDKQMENILVGGYFKSGDIEGLLLALKENFNITSRKDDSGRILLTKL